MVSTSTLPCSKCRAPPTRDGQHRYFECPRLYFEQLGEPCQGFDADGYKPAAWDGDELSAATVAAWPAYIERYNIQPSRAEQRTQSGVEFPIAPAPTSAGRGRGRGGRAT